MRSRTLLLALAMAALLAPVALADPIGPMRPLAVTLDPLEASPTLVWVPGGPADAFRVYGVTGTSRVLVTTTSGDARSAAVPAWFESYAVTALLDDEESPPTYATLNVSCITIRPLPPPPGFGIGSKCYPHLVKVRDGVLP